MKNPYTIRCRYVKPALLVIFIFSFITKSNAQLSITPGVTPAQLVNALLGGGLNVSNITLNCPSNAYGTFANGNTTNIGLNNGILLTTGSAVNAIGPDNSTSSGTCNGTSSSDPQLTALEPLATNDPCILEFDMIPSCNTLQIRFVFGSEEYPEFVNGGFNDAFGFFISGPGPACQAGFYNNTDVATLPDNTTIVSIDNVNNISNSAYYVDNTGGATIQYDGFTTVLTRSVTLCPCQSYHFKLAIADAGDCNYDSGVFVDFMQCSTALTATGSFTPLSGCSACDATATATASGGNAPYTYTWSPSGGNAATATGLCAGTYTCTVSDAGSCTLSQSVIVTIPSNGGVTSSLSTQGNVSCNGGSNGSATVSASGGTGVYTYSWAPSGGSAATATGLSAGTYTCTITDSGGCTSTQQVTITQPSVLTATSSHTDVSCSGGTNGTASVSPAGGSPGYTYSWAPSGGTGATASGLGAGTYTCTITDANGCTTTQQQTITQPTVLTASATHTDVSCNGGSNGTASVIASGGIAGYTYSWAPSGGTGSSASGLPAGIYTVTVTDANGCTTTANTTVTEPTALAVSATNTPAGCAGNDGTATANPSGGTPGYSYSWSPSGGNAAAATGLIPGNYTVTVTDLNGCSSTQSVVITQTSSLTASITSTDVTCFGDANGTATANPISSNPPFTYSWTSGGNTQTESNLGPGTYTVTVTDNTGCTGTATVTITEPPVFTATNTSTNVMCFGGATGTATAIGSGGPSPFTFSWTPTGGNAATASGLTAGTYTCTVTNANGCSATTSVTITQPASAVSATSASANITCNGGTNGTGSVTASGGTPGYTYNWTPSGGTSSSASGLGAGSYTCTITDANGCVTTQSITLTQPSAITASTTQTNVSCNGGSDGTATITASGGTGTLTYNWSPAGGTNANATGLTSGNYTCTITDANGCTTTQTASITQPNALLVSITNDSVCAGTIGSVIASPSGGTGPYTYSWSNGPTTSSQTMVVNTPATFTVNITDANGCTTTGVAHFGIMPSPTAAFTTNAVNGVVQLSNGTAQLCFTDASTGANAWTWDLNGTPSVQQSPCITVTGANSGSFCATLLVVNSNNCADTVYQCVEIGESFYSIPNVFTPGSDGSNDAFIITNTGMKELHCEIYDRWGRLVYEWDGTTGYWDGKTNNGNEAVDGVYYYTAHLVDFADKQIDESGFVQLIRGK